MANLQTQPDIDELAGPEPQVFIRKDGFEPNGAGRGIDLIIDDGEFAFSKRGPIIAIHRKRREGFARLEVLLDLTEVLLGQSKDDGNRL